MRNLLVIISICFINLACAEVSVNEVATLYRNSVFGDDLRIHIATFDAKERTGYNWENCLSTRDLIQNQIGVTVKYWCEKGYFK